MCTAVGYKTKDFYFGRTLDYDYSYHEEVVITPRGYKFPWDSIYAMIGMAYIQNGYPLYYDACNEKGLGIAGLNFVGNAVYHQPREGKINVAQYNFIPFILSTCASVKEVRKVLKNLVITDESFSKELPTAQLHYIIADATESITVESVAEGVMVYDNPVGVLTNNPPFPYQLFNLNKYMGLSIKKPESSFSKAIKFDAFSRGMGAIGLPGDLSSTSRFVRAAFVKLNSISKDTEEESVSQFFHILGSVDQQRGCCELENTSYEITIYTSCMNTTKGIYYYTTYDNHQITAVYLHHQDLDGKELIAYPLRLAEQIHIQN
ncbi:MAG: choloylglycine hydrolase [Anaeroplasmataceae bacterium]|nr:choloylglycine hydrolase [Anaeroplasmataceae bacterium]MDE6414642.1 choloylglycine hydrolase [Anaeroplasmataceae bacterium]